MPTTLKEFLTLSDRQKMTAHQIIEAQGKNNFYSLILQTDLVLLIKLAVCYPKINELCNGSLFDFHWGSIWKKCGDEENNIFYLPQHNMPLFDLVKGIYLYWAYLDQNNHTKEPEEKKLGFDFLNLAAKSGNIHALRTICYFLLQDKNNLNDAIDYAEQAASQHLTPGYILLSFVYATIYYRHQENSFLRKSLTAIFLAEKLEPFSKAEITNAYDSRSLSQVFNIANWFDARKQLLQACDREITTQIYDEANALAKEQFDRIQAQLALTQPSDKEPVDVDTHRIRVPKQ